MNQAQGIRLLTAGLLGAGLFISGAAHSSSCKTLDQNSCSAKASCSWVNGYQRKDGVKVRAHCRTLRGKTGKAPTKDKAKSG